MRLGVFVVLGFVSISYSQVVAQVPVCTTGTTSAVPAGSPAWHEIGDTAYQDVCPANGFGGESYEFANRCNQITEAWGGAALAPNKNLLLIWGGGHNDYFGNEVYALNLNGTFRLCRLTDPAVPIAPRGTALSELTPENGTQPNSRHTYDGLAFIEHADRLWAYSGSLAGTGSPDRAFWIFDPNGHTWMRVHPAGPRPEGGFGIVSAYDPVSGKVFFHDNRTGLYTYEYNSGGGLIEQLSSDGNYGIHYTGVIDPVRRRFYILGGSTQNGGSRPDYYYDISLDSSYARETLRSSGATAIIDNFQAPGAAFDTTLGEVVAWAGGNTVYVLDGDTMVWSSQVVPGSAPSTFGQGTYGRFDYVPSLGVYVTVNDHEDNAFALRLTPGAGEPQPPVVFFSASSTAISSGQQITLSWLAYNASSCIASSTDDQFHGNQATVGSQAIGPLAESQTYTLTCSNGTGDTAIDAAVAVGEDPVPDPVPDPGPVDSGDPQAGASDDGSSASALGPAVLAVLLAMVRGRARRRLGPVVTRGRTCRCRG